MRWKKTGTQPWRKESGRRVKYGNKRKRDRGERRFLKKQLLRMTELLYPRKCPLCDGILGGKEPLLCRNCGKKLKFAEEPRCFRCGKPLVREEEEYCHDCRRNAHVFER